MPEPQARPQRREVVERPGPGESGGLDSAAALFDLLWVTLADLLGTAATAALLRRAIKHAAPRYPELSGLVIRREDLAYVCAVPPAWREGTDAAAPALLSLFGHLCPLLVELTGQVAVRRLERVPELRRWIVFAQEKQA